jgi:RimJ/RimL family protein N-acetyltransferase
MSFTAEHPEGLVSLILWNDDAGVVSPLRTTHDWFSDDALNTAQWDTPGGPLSVVLKIWDQLKKQNAICTLPTDPDIFSFSSHETCLLFATIAFTKHEQLSSNTKSQKGSPSKPFAGDELMDDLDDSVSPWKLEKNTRFTDPKDNKSPNASSSSGDDLEAVWRKLEPTVATPVGCLYLSLTRRPQEASIGIVLLPEYTNHGIGPLALNLALELAFDTYKFHRVCAVVTHHPENAQAIKVFKKLLVPFMNFQLNPVH